MFPKILKKDWYFVAAVIILGILIRTLNFSDSLNFSSDQAKFSIKALEILRNENEGFVWKGPAISLQLEGREIYQGGIIYYFQAFFLWLGNLDPVSSSLAFMLFASLMAIPLFLGTKFVMGSDKAKFVTILYCLLPVFINYTKFLWNPNFQLSLLPLLVLFIGLFKKSARTYWLFAAGIWLGLLLQFHFQMFLGGLILLWYLRFYLKTPAAGIVIFIMGSVIGFLPMIILDFKNNFSNFNTLLFYLQNFSGFNQANSESKFFANQHYFLSLILIVLIVILSFIKKINLKFVYAAFFLLLISDLVLYYPKPVQGFGMAKNWKYQDEAKAFQIIKEQNSDQYNMTNLSYDSLAWVQQYLHKENKLENRVADYWEARRMFVIAPKTKDISHDSTYEIQVVKPFKILKQWELSRDYALYLLEKS